MKPVAFDAARREAREEINLALAHDAFLGRLDDYPTRSGYLITPLVAWCAETSALAPNPAEVERIYRVPLAQLGPGPEFVAIPESDRPVVRYPLLGRATRVAHLEQPVWAWR